MVFGLCLMVIGVTLIVCGLVRRTVEDILDLPDIEPYTYPLDEPWRP